jgi:hypothetical protein
VRKTISVSGFLAVLIVAMLVLPFSVVEVKAQTTASRTVPSVLFNAMEVGVDANTVVLTVDSVNYTIDAFPLRLTWVNGSTHTFEYARFVSTTVKNRYYVLLLTDTYPTKVSSPFTYFYFTNADGNVVDQHPSTFWGYYQGANVEFGTVDAMQMYLGDLYAVCGGYHGTFLVPPSLLKFKRGADPSHPNGEVELDVPDKNVSLFSTVCSDPACLEWSPPFGLAIYDYADPSKPQGPSNAFAYVFAAKRIFQIDLNTFAVSSLTINGRVVTYAFVPGYLYFVDSADPDLPLPDRFLRVAIPAFSTLQTINLQAPFSLCTRDDPSPGEFFFYAVRGSPGLDSELVKISLSSLSVVGVLPGLQSVYWFGGKLYSHDEKHVVRIDPTTFTVEATSVSLGDSLSWGWTFGASGHVYVAFSTLQANSSWKVSLAKIHNASMLVESTLEIETFSEVVGADDDYLYIQEPFFSLGFSLYFGNLAKINLNTFTITKTLTSSWGPYLTPMTKAQFYIYVSDGTTGVRKILPIDLTSFEIAQFPLLIYASSAAENVFYPSNISDPSMGVHYFEFGETVEVRFLENSQYLLFGWVKDIWRTSVFEQHYMLVGEEQTDTFKVLTLYNETEGNKTKLVPSDLFIKNDSVTITMDGWHYLNCLVSPKFKVKFDAHLSGDVVDPVLQINDVNYTITELPTLVVPLVYNIMEPLCFKWYSPVSTASGTKYVWNSSTGLSTAQRGIIYYYMLSGDGSVGATYLAESPTNHTGQNQTTSIDLKYNVGVDYEKQEMRFAYQVNATPGILQVNFMLTNGTVLPLFTESVNDTYQHTHPVMFSVLPATDRVKLLFSYTAQSVSLNGETEVILAPPSPPAEFPWLLIVIIVAVLASCGTGYTVYRIRKKRNRVKKESISS